MATDKDIWMAALDDLLKKASSLLLSENDKETIFEMISHSQVIPEEDTKHDIPPLEGDTNPINDRCGNSTLINLLPNITLQKFRRGDNFARFCTRFIDLTELNNVSCTNLNLFFLQLIEDDKTYTLLRSIQLDDAEKQSAQLFCKRYKFFIYGEENTMILKTQFMNCTQNSHESIADYAYRLTVKADIAFSDEKSRSENCLLVFLTGIKDKNIQIKLNEACPTNFQEAVKHAKRLENIDKMFNSRESGDSSVLASYSYRPKGKERSSYRSKYDPDNY